MFGSEFLGLGETGQNGTLVSGFDIKQIKGGYANAQQDFRQALDTDVSTATPETINQTAQMTGQYAALSLLAGKQSQQSLKLAQEANKYKSVILRHHQGAIAAELQHQKQTAQFLQGVTPQLLDMGIVQHQQSGYSSICAIAEQTIQF